jgi:putative endonuclease
VDEHKRGVNAGFTSRYRITRLVYFEEFADIRDAITREKQVKDWTRKRRVALVEQRNPFWQDLKSRSLAPRAFGTLRSG